MKHEDYSKKENDPENFKLNLDDFEEVNSDEDYFTGMP